MCGNLWQILLIEDNLDDVVRIRKKVSQPVTSPLAQGSHFEVSNVNSLSAGLQQIETQKFDLVVLDLSLSDKEPGIDRFSQIQDLAKSVPLIVLIDREDETQAVNLIQYGVLGYFQKDSVNSNLLAYSIRLAREQQQELAKIEQSQHQQQQALEFQNLEQVAQDIKSNVTVHFQGIPPLSEGLPEIFNQLVQRYGELMDMSLERQAYKIEHNISEHLRNLADRLGFVQAGPRDVVQLHTIALKQKTHDINPVKARAYVAEGRLMVLELMGYLTAFYRKYYIGLNQINRKRYSDDRNSNE